MGFNKLPKRIQLILLLFKGLDFKESLTLIRYVLYLYREFYITTSIQAVVKEYVVSFYYKDTNLLNTKVRDIQDLISIIKDMKRVRKDD